ncbi:MAG: hypothetical protein GX359_10415 [Clostridiales bacterium]|nr:hypothetical protein [Clostridiales bacterium]
MKHDYEEKKDIIEGKENTGQKGNIGQKETTRQEKGAEIDDRNLKEKLYDKIPISLKALDILITILISIFVLIMLYFIVTYKIRVS